MKRVWAARDLVFFNLGKLSAIRAIMRNKKKRKLKAALRKAKRKIRIEPSGAMATS
jgi:hypothetical protein